MNLLAVILSGIIPCAILLVGLFFIPESPRWLAKVGKRKFSYAALQILRGKDTDISAEVAEIQEYIETLQTLPKTSIWDLFGRRYIHPVIIGVGLMVFQQFGGINGIGFYKSLARFQLKQHQFSGNSEPFQLTVEVNLQEKKIDEILEEGVSELKDKLPILLVLNKKDLIKPGEIAKKLEWYQKFTHVDDVIPVSAKYGAGVDDVKDWILSKLPLGPSYYPKDIASEHPERFFVAEIVREKIFMQYRKEVPYACQVNVVSYISLLYADTSMPSLRGMCESMKMFIPSLMS